MTKKLHISPKLALPADAVTSTIVVYGGKGMGKTNFANVLVEEFAAAGQRFSVIDPMGVFWGLRHGADGKSPGIKILILGGRHGDMPITPESGALVADLVVDEDDNVVIDISRRADGSMWAIAERIRFVRDYAKRLYQRNGEKLRPIHQVIDEAARFAPQVVRHGEGDIAACMGAIAVLVEEGRNVGIGVTLATQRSARLNKDVAELADAMIAFRIIGPNSMSAVLDWLGEHIEKARLKTLSDELRSLERGSALVVSPGWLQFEGIVPMRKRHTFDSSKTPEGGKQVRATGGGAPIDLDKYKERLATLIEEQASNDPKALKTKIAELTKQLAKGAKMPSKVIEHVVEKSVVSKAALVAIERLSGAHVKSVASGMSLAERAGAMMVKAAEMIAASSLKLETELAKLRSTISGVQLDAKITKVAATAMKDEYDFTGAVRGKFHRPNAQVRLPASRPGGANGHAPKRLAKPASVAPATAAEVDASLRPAHLRILSAIAWWEGLGVDAPDFTGVAFVAGKSANSSSFENDRSRLRAAGYIDYAGAGRMRLTDAGRALTPAPTLDPTNDAIQAQVMGMIEPAKWRMLHATIAAYPNELSYEEVAERAGASAASSSFENNRSWLRARGLIEYSRAGHMRATTLLFPEGAA